MDFKSEMSQVKNAEVGAQYISTASIEVVTIKAYKLVSPEKGTPYLELTLENDKKEINTTRLYRVKDGDSPESKEYKLKRIKEILENAGANFSLDGEDVIKSAIGLKIKALFKEVEYIGYDKNNFNRPEIRTKIEYSFSSKVDSEINGNQSYFKSNLSEKDNAKFQGELLMWERDNKVQSTQQGNIPDSQPVSPKMNDTDDTDDIF